MTQTRLGSLIEAIVNVLIGYWISVTAQHFIFPMFGYHITLKENLLIGLIFTVISIARSYLLRRYFNARLHRLTQRITEKL
jgi:hypothetical protein